MGIVDRSTPGDPAGRTLLEVADMMSWLETYADGMVEVASRFKQGDSEAAYAMRVVYEFAREVEDVCKAAGHDAQTWHSMFKDPDFNRPGPDLGSRGEGERRAEGGGAMTWKHSDPAADDYLSDFGHRLRLAMEYAQLAEVHGRGEEGRSRYAVEILNNTLAQLHEDYDEMYCDVIRYINEIERGEGKEAAS